MKFLVLNGSKVCIPMLKKVANAPAYGEESGYKGHSWTMAIAKINLEKFEKWYSKYLSKNRYINGSKVKGIMADLIK